MLLRCPFHRPLLIWLAMKNILIICAMPQESAPILRRFPSKEKIASLKIPSWRFFAGNNSVTLAVSGMGTARATLATSTLIESLNPDMVLSIGFCGAVRPGLATGDLVIATEQYLFANGTLSKETGPDETLTAGLQKMLLPRLSHECRTGSFITTETPAIKSSIFDIIPYNIVLPVLEMETCATIGICNSARIPAAAFRTVSDAWDEDPAPLLDRILGPELAINKARAAAGLLSNPALLPLAFRLARNAKKAGRALADAVTGILETME